jgi:large subunit ribosomal protein L10
VNRNQKSDVIEEVATQIRESQAVFAVDYRGVTVKQAGVLRDRLLEAEATFRVVKNTLTERAAEQAGSPGLKSLLAGPTALTFVRGDAAVAAKALAGFRRETQLVSFKGGTLDGDTLTVDQLESIARLPSREVLQGQFVGVLASPITGLVRGLSGLISGLAVALGEIQERGLVGGGATAPAAEAATDAPSEPPDEAPGGSEGPEETPTPSEAPGDPVAEATAAESDET